MTPARIVRSIESWWWKRSRIARLDDKARERRNAIARQQKRHGRTRPLYAEQFKAMTEKLRQEVGHG